MRALPDIMAGLALLMLLLTVALLSQRSVRVGVRLITAQSAALALATALLALAANNWPLFLFAVLMLIAKTLVLPIFLRREALLTPDQPGAILPLMLASGALVALAWLATPSLPGGGTIPGLHREIIAPVLGILLVGLMPSLISRPPLARLLGLLAAENGLMLLAIHLPGPIRVFMIQLATFSLVGALLAGLRAQIGTRAP